jgi:aspartate aminotransferase
VWAQVGQEDFTPFDPGELITPRTKIIVVNSPCNPTGAVFDKKNLKAIADLARDHDFLVLSDEIYEKIIYDKEHISIGSLDGMEERTITINGFSKAYAMTGWRLGYALAPKNIFEQMLKLHSHSVSQAGSFVQYGGLAALKGDQNFILEMVKEFRARRDLIVQGLNRIGLKCSLPDGAFYAFPDVGEYGDGESFSEMLLTKAQVATTPGPAFGPTDTSYIRISYATSRERIKEGLKRIESVLNF